MFGHLLFYPEADAFKFAGIGTWVTGGEGAVSKLPE